MNRALVLRLSLLMAAIAGMAALMLWGVQHAWRQTIDLEDKLTAANLKSFRLANELQGHLLNLDNTILRYASHHDPALWSEFDRASRKLDQWIDEQQNRQPAENERALLAELRQVYDEYLKAARQVRATIPPPSANEAESAELTALERHSEHLRSLGLDLAEAHRKREVSFLADANRSLAHVRLLLLAGLGLLLTLMGGLGGVLYRDMIAPLRTRLVESRALLERQEKLATLGTLAAGIAHEIRNPLTALKARLFTLEKHVGQNQPALTDTGFIGSEINRLDKIVQNFLQFARPAEPQAEVVAAEVPLREVRDLVVPTLDSNRVRLVLEPTSPGLWVSIDVSLLKQVLLNLVRNAIESIAASGTVVLRAHASQMRLAGQVRPVAILEVADTGQGISPETQKRLFDPFFSTKDSGTGLGLAIAARIVEKHGGALRYQTAVGHGTTFGVVLPLVPAPPCPAPLQDQHVQSAAHSAH